VAVAGPHHRLSDGLHRASLSGLHRPAYSRAITESLASNNATLLQQILQQMPKTAVFWAHGRGASAAIVGT
jgi:hypothetical protein